MKILYIEFLFFWLNLNVFISNEKQGHVTYKLEEFVENFAYSVYFAQFFLLLCRFGGLYLDSDIIVLKSLASLNNTVGREDQIDEQSLNGAVMAFTKHRYYLYELFL